MKFSIIICFCLLSLSICSQSLNITGTITGKALIAIKDVQFFSDGNSQKLVVDKEKGTFGGIIEIKEPQFLEVKIGGNQASYIYVVPGESFDLQVSKPTVAESEIIISEGNINKLNKILKAYQEGFTASGITYGSRNFLGDIMGKPQSIDIASSKADFRINENLNFIQSFAPTFSNDLKVMAEVSKNWASIDEMTLDQIEGKLKELKDSGLKVTALTIPYFREYLVDLTNAYAARKLEGYDISLEFIKQGYISQHVAAEAIVKYSPTKSIVNFLLSEKINRELIVNGLKNKNYSDFMLSNIGPTTMKMFEERIQKLKTKDSTNVKGERKDAFNFTLHDADGKAYTLADFKGKMVLLDFWASWCAPCKAQMPHMKELEKIYHDKDIVFASVSLDNTKKAWLKGVESEKLTGMVLHAEGAFKNALPMAYDIQSIPRFILIDANGKLITDDLPKPQFKKEVMAIIDADLYSVEINKIVQSHLNAIGADVLKTGSLVHTSLTQKLPGLETNLDVWYQYPKNIKLEMQIVENPQMVIMLGEEFFKKKTSIMKNDTVFGNGPNINKLPDSWYNKIFGLEIFTLHHVMGAKFDFAEENTDNKENHFVLKCHLKDKTIKFFINKNDFMIRKVVELSKVDPRKGGGKIEAFTSYDEFKIVNGVTLPTSVNANNIITATVKDIFVDNAQNDVFK